MTIAIASRTKGFIRGEMSSNFRVESRNHVCAGAVANFTSLTPFITLHRFEISGA